MVIGDAVSRSGVELAGRVLSPGGDYRADWLADGDKQVSPFFLGKGLTVELRHRMVAGCRAGGAAGLFAVSLQSNRIDNSTSVMPLGEFLERGLTDFSDRFLVVSSSFDGAMLSTVQGCVLIAGDSRFMRSAVPEGVDQARAEFARYAKKLKDKLPGLMCIAREFGPRKGAWKRSEDVAEGSGTAEQLNLMRAFVAGSLSAREFATGWLDARRRAMNEGDRVISPLAVALDEVFSALEDYSIDPVLRDPDDLTDEELVERVREITNRMDSV
ncbi:colicin immunity domain-containing protein [Streptomyces sp. NRRL F-4489]|uniref:colicin immunity domain-containing protein n=1 Tax=Streptomyces sp. NRRL F-4489 TaxID=1609095 RepID=UPI00099EBC5D|nr:colicin immunity domain-containing protein [Streptomyces sp. NRRL F-4489]